MNDSSFYKFYVILNWIWSNYLPNITRSIFMTDFLLQSANDFMSLKTIQIVQIFQSIPEYLIQQISIIQQGI